MPGYAPGDFVPPHARQVVYFCPLTQGSSKQYRCPAARKRKADECKVRDKCDQGAKKVRMGVTDLNNGVIDQASGGVTAVIYTLWQSLFRLHPGNGWNQISMIKGTKIPSIFNKSPFLQLTGCPTRSFRLSLRKHPFLLAREERGETDVFAGYFRLRLLLGKISLIWSRNCAWTATDTRKRLPLYKLCSHASLRGLHCPRLDLLLLSILTPNLGS